MLGIWGYARRLDVQTRGCCGRNNIRGIRSVVYYEMGFMIQRANFDEQPSEKVGAITWWPDIRVFWLNGR